MSAELLGWAYRQRTGSAITKAVLIKLVDNANDYGYAHPSTEHLAAFLELSDRALREHLKKLEELCLLKVIRQKVAEKVNLPNRYQLLIDNISTLGEITKNRGGMEPDATPLPGPEPEGGAGDAIGVGRNLPREPSSSNPQENPQAETSQGALVVHAPSEIDLAIEAFNSGAELTGNGQDGSGWARATSKPTDARKKAITARLKEVGLPGWRAAVMRASASDFLAGRAKRSSDHSSWRVDLGWFSKAENFTKVVEGKYDNGGGGRGPGGSTTMDSAFRGISDAFNRNH